MLPNDRFEFFVIVIWRHYDVNNKSIVKLTCGIFLLYTNLEKSQIFSTVNKV